ncbi:hypothetical protein JXB22_07580 [candidate division WOR-3 bacterium]|nr:hypothetical protein [candidate division WOR-3 bacterium]
MEHLILSVLPVIVFAQTLPLEWSQSYGTYDRPVVHDPGGYSLGFSINNYAFYVDESEEDSISYDTRRFDIFAQLGIGKNAELEFKFSYPTCGVVSAKYMVAQGRAGIAAKIGFGYMKGTRAGFITDYVLDFYPGVLLSYQLTGHIAIYGTPKMIYSIHARDRREHSDREPRYIFQYGPGIGIAIGTDFTVMVESNWLWGDNEGITYTVNQFGVGVTVTIR